MDDFNKNLLHSFTPKLHARSLLPILRLSYFSREFKLQREKNQRLFSRFSEDTFYSELYNVLSTQISYGDSFDVDKVS